jgi:hypothetical protein
MRSTTQTPRRPEAQAQWRGTGSTTRPRGRSEQYDLGASHPLSGSCVKRISITIGASAMLAIAPVHALTCQRIEALRAGDAIRVSVSPGKQIEGRLVSISADTIVLRGPTTPIPIAFSSITLLQVKRRSGKSFTRSVVIGLLGGAVGTALVGLFSGSTNTGDGTITAMDKATIGLVTGGAAGLIGGSVYGACCSSAWEPVPLTRRQ